MQEYLSNLLKTGGLDEGLIGQNINALTEQGGRNATDIGAQVSASMPLGSTAAVSALTKGLSDNRLDTTKAILDFLLTKGQQGVQNKMGAIGGMQALPSYIQSPSSIELAMMNAKQPYDIANLNSQNDWMSQLLGGTAASYYTPEMALQKSKWESTVMPLISGIIAGLMKGP